jgi:Ca2+-binding RTX toxin-like protein
VTGSGNLTYVSNWDDWNNLSGKNVTGTAGNDTFYSYWASDTLRGGGGNDTFHVGGGVDTVYSEANDADLIYIDFWGEGHTTIKGFNGAGSLTGDKLYVSEYIKSHGSVDYINGNTVFNVGQTPTYTVEGVDLRQGEGIDWFLI